MFWGKFRKLSRIPKLPQKIQQLIILKLKNLRIYEGFKIGGGGIRTHGTLQTYDSFQDCSNQPLWHSSNELDCILIRVRLY